MARILSIDYGRKRTGLAVSDPLQLIAGGLSTVATHDLEAFLLDYIPREGVETVIVGKPMQMNGEMSESWRYIEPFLRRLRKLMPDLPILLVDERFTSVLAQQAIREAGVGKMERRQNKGLVDEVSATILLQSFLEHRRGEAFVPR